MKNGVRLAFDSTQTAPVQLPRVAVQPLSNPLIWRNASGTRSVVWDWHQGQLIVDVPEAKALLGDFDFPYTFADGLQISATDSATLAFGVASIDGLPLVQSREIFAAATAARAASASVATDSSPARNATHIYIDWPPSARHRIDTGTIPSNTATTIGDAARIALPINNGEPAAAERSVK